jgi:hypothetical protein
MTQLANKAATGDLRAIRMLFEVNRRRKDPATPTPAAPAAEASRPHPKPPLPDFDKMTTRELEVLFEAAMIMEGTRERPPPPVPPGGPEESEK